MFGHMVTTAHQKWTRHKAIGLCLQPQISWDVTNLSEVAADRQASSMFLYWARGTNSVLHNIASWISRRSKNSRGGRSQTHPKAYSTQACEDVIFYMYH